MFRVENLSAKYGNKSVFSNLSFTLPENQITALCGMNGKGKSTLLSLMAGIIPSDLNFQGKIYLDEENLLKKSPKEKAKKISYLVQNEFNVWDISVFDLVMDGRFVHKKPFNYYSSRDLEIVEEAIQNLSLEELKNRKISTLSGGEFQRTRIARALVQETKYIFMDEALSALDINHQKDLIKLLSKICKEGKTIFISIHDINLASIWAENLLMLKNDRKGFFMGKAQDLIQTDILKQVYSSDFQIYTHPITGAKQIF